MKGREGLKFQFELCRELGITRRELLSATTSKELSEWQAHTQMEPLYKRRTCYILAQIACMIGNFMVEDDEFKMKDFIPEIQEQTEPADLAEKAKQINRVLGGKDKQD